MRAKRFLKQAVRGSAGDGRPRPRARLVRLRQHLEHAPDRALRRRVVASLNVDRAANGLPPLTWSPKLANQAGTWAATMADGELALPPEPERAASTRPTTSGYSTLGENILVGPGNMSPAAMEAAWMNSPPHQANILSGAFNIVGIGYVRGPDGRIWAVQDFGGI